MTWTGTSPNNGTNGVLDLGSSPPFAAKWTSSAAIAAFLPFVPTVPGQPGASGPLTEDLINPTSTSARVFGAQLVAATLNATFNLNNVPGVVGNDTTTKLVDLKFQACNFGVPPSVQGLTVGQVLQLSEIAVSGLATTVPIEDLTQALDAFNNNFDNCDTNLSCLAK